MLAAQEEVLEGQCMKSKDIELKKNAPFWKIERHEIEAQSGKDLKIKMSQIHSLSVSEWMNGNICHKKNQIIFH